MLIFCLFEYARMVIISVFRENREQVERMNKIYHGFLFLRHLGTVSAQHYKHNGWEVAFK